MARLTKVAAFAALLCVASVAAQAPKPAPRQPLPTLAETAPAPAPARASSMRGVNALSGDAAPLLPGAIPLDPAAVAAAAAAASSGAAPVVPMAAYAMPGKFDWKRGIPATPISGAPVARAPPAIVEAPPKAIAGKVVPVWVKPGAAPQVVLERKTVLPATAIPMPGLSVLLPAKQKAAPVSGVSGVPMTKKEKFLAALGGK